MTELTAELNQDNSGIWTLKLVGGIDTDTYQTMWIGHTSADLLKRLVAAKAQKLVIDLTATERIDSQGLRLLLNAHKEFSKEKIEIILKNPNPYLKRLFQIMQFDRVFSIDSDH
jgi:anti-sigma B factor antagonist